MSVADAHVLVNPMSCTTSSALADPVHRSASSTAPKTIVPFIHPPCLRRSVTTLQHVRNLSGNPGAKRLRHPLPWLSSDETVLARHEPDPARVHHHPRDHGGDRRPVALLDPGRPL